jgi:hypothetical protein
MYRENKFGKRVEICDFYVLYGAATFHIYTFFAILLIELCSRNTAARALLSPYLKLKIKMRKFARNQ